MLTVTSLMKSHCRLFLQVIQVTKLTVTGKFDFKTTVLTQVDVFTNVRLNLC